MKKLFLILILSFLSAQSFAGSCPDGSEPTKTVSADGTYYEFKCADRSSGIDNYDGAPEIPYWANPNYETLKYYLYKYLYSDSIYSLYEVKASNNPYKFQFDLREDNYVKKQMQETALLSYQLYEDGKIVIDEKTPEDRFGDMFRDSSKFHSQSLGKSIVSYITGHAICAGYIDSVDSRLDDWPIIQNTLFHNQKLIDLLNMAAGDQKYSKINLTKGGKKWSKNPNRNTVKYHMEKGIFKKTKGKKSANKYNYSNIVSNMLINYAAFKSGDNFQNLLDKVFISKAKIQNPAYFKVMHSKSVQGKYKVDEKNDGAIRYSFVASRYDYLRIAKAMLDDWQNDTCVGKYLKTIHKKRIPKNDKYSDDKGSFFYSKAYAGQFHTDFPKLKDRAVMAMEGASGQSIIIDFDKGKINVINSIHTNYDWKKIAISKFN